MGFRLITDWLSTGCHPARWKYVHISHGLYLTNAANFCLVFSKHAAGFESVCFMFYFEISVFLSCLNPIPGVFTFPVMITCPRPNGLHQCLIIVPVCVYINPHLFPCSVRLLCLCCVRTTCPLWFGISWCFFFLCLWMFFVVATCPLRFNVFRCFLNSFDALCWCLLVSSDILCHYSMSL